MNRLFKALSGLLLIVVISLAVVSATPTVEWTRTFGSSQYEDVRDVIQAPDGGYVVYGTTASEGQRQLWLLKLDMQGDIGWENTYGGHGSETAWSMTTAEDGGYLLAGSFAATEDSPRGISIYKVSPQGELEWEYISVISYNANRPLILESEGGGCTVFSVATQDGTGGILHTLLTAEGELIETRFILTEPGHSIPNDVVQLDDGRVLLFGEGGSADYSVWDGLLMSFSSEGTFEWTTRVGGTGSEEGYGIAQTSDNAVIVIGNSTSPGTRGPDFYLSKLSLDGSQLWYRNYGGSSGDVGFAVEATNDGGAFAIGTTFGISGRSGIYLFRVDGDGARVWSTVVGARGDFGYSVRSTTDGGLILGAVENMDGPRRGDILVIKMSSDE
jgi:hypothetical protein